MKDEEKKQMFYEAEKQSKLLKNLSRWSRNFMGLSSVGVVIAYYGLSHSETKFTFGVLFTVICVVACLLINLAIRNGRKNVNNILKIISNK